MTGEEQQDQAALYALGLLTAEEAAAFEATLRDDPALGSLVRALKETAHHLVLGYPAATPPPALRNRVLSLVAAENKAAGASPAAAAKIVALRPFAWVPWAIAAGLAVFCGLLVTQRSDLRRELAAVRASDPLSQVAVYTLGPAGEHAPAEVSVAWVPARQSGKLDVHGLPYPGKGKDYQLWAVDAGSKEPISAGLVKIDENGHAQITFKPDNTATHVNAFAISLEPEGGSPKKTGPIVFVGAE